MVATATETVVPKHRIGTECGNVLLRCLPDIAGQFPRAGISRLFGEDPNQTALSPPVSGHVVPDDVIVQDGLNFLAFRFRPIRVEGAADQANFFPRKRYEYQSLFKLVLAHHTSQFHNNSGATGIVADARRGRQGRLFGVHRVGCAVPAGTKVPGTFTRHNGQRVVVASDEDALLRFRGAGQDCHHVHKLHVAEDTGLFFHLPRVVADLEAGAVALQFVVDPGAGGFDAIAGLVRIRENTAGSKVTEVLHGRADSVPGNLRNKLLDKHIGLAGLAGKPEGAAKK